MDTYTEAVALIEQLPLFHEWPEMHTIFQRAAISRPHGWRLPEIACQAVGGTPEQALQGTVAIACQQISILLIDDLLDADPRGEYHRLGMPAVANLAAAFQAAA